MYNGFISCGVLVCEAVRSYVAYLAFSSMAPSGVRYDNVFCVIQPVGLSDLLPHGHRDVVGFRIALVHPRADYHRQRVALADPDRIRHRIHLLQHDKVVAHRHMHALG